LRSLAKFLLNLAVFGKALLLVKFCCSSLTKTQNSIDGKLLCIKNFCIFQYFLLAQYSMNVPFVTIITKEEIQVRIYSLEKFDWLLQM